MDYSILKTLEAPPSYMFPKQRKFNLPKNPHIDYVNPGIGFVTKSYEFFIPVFGTSFPYPLKKKDVDESDRNESSNREENKKAESQEGKGENDDIIEREEKEIDTTKELNSSTSKDNNSESIFKNKKRLADTIFDAFMHPKIKTAKLSIPKKSSSQKSQIKHKFNVV